eukprot:12918046-Prorocentrum_lima.AAC.1
MVDGLYARKQTRGTTNCWEVGRVLEVRCQVGHEHRPVLRNTACKAERYPPWLVRAVLRALRARQRKSRST